MEFDFMRVLNTIVIAFLPNECSQRTPAPSERHQRVLLLKSNNDKLFRLAIYIQGVTGGMDQTSGGCSLC